MRNFTYFLVFSIDVCLDLDEISSTESANFSSVSDITGETYNSVSEFDDDDYDFTSHIENLEEDEESSNSQIIDISNDSSGSRSQFGKYSTVAFTQPLGKINNVKFRISTRLYTISCGIRGPRYA